MPTASVSITWTEGQECLVFKFPEILTKSAAQKAIEVWNREYSLKSGKSCLIWDCTHMKDYEPMARILWQKAMKEHMNKIQTIWLISESTMIRTAAKLLAMFVQADIKPVKSREDIPTPALELY